MFIIHNCKNIFIFMFIMHNMYLTDQIPKYLNLKRNEQAEVYAYKPPYPCISMSCLGALALLA